jgi:hypothetical protein
VYYLQHRRFADAAALFSEFREQAPAEHKKAFDTLGRLGQACVLAYQGQTAESNRLFLDVLVQKREVDQLAYLLRQGDLRREIEKALNYNKSNAPPFFRHKAQVGGLLAAAPHGPLHALPFLNAKEEKPFPPELESYRETAKALGFKLLDTSKGKNAARPSPGSAKGLGPRGGKGGGQ